MAEIPDPQAYVIGALDFRATGDENVMIIGGY